MIAAVCQKVKVELRKQMAEIMAHLELLQMKRRHGNLTGLALLGGEAVAACRTS